MARARKRRLILRPLADLDIDYQFEYLAIEAGSATAKRFIKALASTCKTLQTNPDLGSPRTFADPRLARLRVWPVRGFRRHLIFYIPSTEALEVVRVIHAARDVDSLLADS